MQTNTALWYDDLIELRPRHLAGSDSWAGHIPFACFLIGAQSPGVLVELGVFAGNSLFAFAQAADQCGCTTQIVGVDTWQSDPHSGGYDGDAMYRTVCQQQALYPALVELKRATFDAVRPDFAPASIDVLHIDGYHHYDAVSHDFQSWHDAVKPDGIILFHDISVRRDDFGVWRFWDEIKARYGVERTLEFAHSNGLGVLFLGEAATYGAKLKALRAAYAEDPAAVQAIFRLAGERIVEQFAHLQTRRAAEEAAARLNAANAALTADLRELQQKYSDVINSKSWRLTRPLRAIRRKAGV